MNFKVFSLVLFLNSIIYATWFDDIPRTIYQPDGNRIDCLISGDQYFRRLHDENNYTIIHNTSDGYYYYARLINDELIPSNWRADYYNPQNLGLKSGLSISKEKYNEKKENHYRYLNHNSRDAPTSGQINQINVFIRFADDPDFIEPRSYYNQIFQTDDDEPSLQHYFSEISENELYIRTYHFPQTTDDINIAYIDDFDRSYYQPYSSSNPNGYTDDQRTEREHALLANAIGAISSEVSPTIDIDGNNDGYVDGVSFVIYGDPGDWATLLWPHRWALFSETVLINNIQVYDYMFMLSESWYYNVGVLCHEFGHVLGAPDYYHYDGGGAPTPVGGWDLMASNGNPPQYPSAYTKWKYFDWLPEIPEITIGGNYTLFPMTQQEDVSYKIASPNSLSEYFVMEYRKQEGMYELNLPGTRSGLLVYRVNTEAGNGNAQGPPDELYVYRPGGSLNVNGDLNSAPFSSAYDQSSINEDTDPAPFLYNDGEGAAGGLNLFGISDPEEYISFNVILGTPEIMVNIEEINFNLELGEIGNETILLSNSGEDGTILDYQINFYGEPPFIEPFNGPGDGNYYYVISDDNENINYDWIDIDGISIELSMQHNDEFSSEVISLPFLFPFYNEMYDYVQVNANGWVGWSSANETAWSNLEIPSSEAPHPAIFGFFDDLNPENDDGNTNASGNIYYHTDNNRAVIWFDDVVRWSVDDWGQFDFQIVLYPNGRFKVNYREMQGVTNSASVGFQNESGTEGSQIVHNQNFIESNISWAAQSSNGNIPWLYVSTSNGDLSGYLLDGESEEIYVNVITSDINTGNYSASIEIESELVEPVIIPIELSLSSMDSIPQLPFIDISNSVNGIISMPEDDNSLFSSIASRYTHLTVSNGGVIPILIQDEIEDYKVLHIRGILESFLKDVPGTQWGNDKSSISNAIASNNAMIFLLNDESEIENSDLISLFDLGVDGQIIISDNIVSEGTSEYINGLNNDLSYQLILDFIYNHGIQLVVPGMVNQLEESMINSISNNIYEPSMQISEQNHLLRYFKLGLEVYYGLWEFNPNQDGFAGDYEYGLINRSQLQNGDSLLYGILNNFFNEFWTYNAVLPSIFNSSFDLTLDTNSIYTYKSQYLKDVTLKGSNESSLIGNNYNNYLEGNHGRNYFVGGVGSDTLNGGLGLDRAVYLGEFAEYIVVPMDEPIDSAYRVIDIVNNRDGLDYIMNIEQIEFGGELFFVSDILKLEDKVIPSHFKLQTPFPNPFNPFVNVNFSIAKPCRVDLRIYDLKGKIVKNITDKTFNPGNYNIVWDAKDNLGNQVSTGVYYLKLSAQGHYQKTQKVLFLK